MSKHQILVVDDDDSLRRVLQMELEQSGYSVIAAASALEALTILRARSCDLVITDLKMPGMSGLDLLRQVLELYPEVIAIILTAFGTVDTAVEAMKAGAYHYITKPVHPDELLLVVGRALEHYRLTEEVKTLRANLNDKYGFENILGRSDVLLQVLDMASRAART